MLVEAVGLSSSQMENSSALADVAPRTSTEDARPRVTAPANSFLRITNARSSELFQHTDGTSKVLKIFKRMKFEQFVLDTRTYLFGMTSSFPVERRAARSSWPCAASSKE